MLLPHRALFASFLVTLLPAFAGCADDPTSQDTTAGDTTSSGGGGAGTASSTGGSGESSGGSGGSSGSPELPPPGMDIIDLPRAVDLTPDGSIALMEGWDANATELQDYFYDTITKELVLKTSAGNPLSDFATGISATLRISANYEYPVNAGLWTEADGWMKLPSPYTDCGGDVASAWDVSADGSVAVGMLWNGCHAEAFRWTDTGGEASMKPLALLGSAPNGAPNNRATVVSDDGQVVAGFAQTDLVDRTPAIWQADGTGTLIDPTNEWPGEILAISPDGKMVTGTHAYDAFKWTEADGMQSLGAIPGEPEGQQGYPNAIAADGALIFGGYGDPFQTLPIAFVWTEKDGMRSLQAIAETAGIEIPDGVHLANVMAASTDGSVVIGWAYDSEGNTVSFVLRLPVTAYGI